MQNQTQIQSIFEKINESTIQIFRVEYEGNFPLPLKNILLDRQSTQSLKQTTDAYQNGFWVEYGFKRAIIDPEFYSIKRAIAGFSWESQIKWVRKSYLVFVPQRGEISSVEAAVQSIIESHSFNAQVHEIYPAAYNPSSLIPTSKPAKVETISIRSLSNEQLYSLSEQRRLFLPENQFVAIREFFKTLEREPTDCELEMIAQSWCDHCSHTTWKSLGLMKTLQLATQNIMKNRPDILSVFSDNAGVMAFYDGYAVAIKGETHNSPTMLAPAPGVETMVGGVLRDIIGCGKGFYPIGATWVFATQSLTLDHCDIPTGCHHPSKVAHGMIKGFETYANPMGVPNIGGCLIQNNGYAKPLALGVAIGIGLEEHSQKGEPSPGDLVMIMGGGTGRDGIHGATTSSSGSTEESSEKDAAHVQIGTPIFERYFMTAIMELRDKNLVQAVTDFGAGGLSSAAGEMGNPAGIEIELSNLPLKYAGLTAWEILLSESQERMLLCINPKDLKPVQEICQQNQVPIEQIGTFTDTGRCVMTFNKKTVVNLPFSFLHGGCPIDILSPEPVEQDKNTYYLDDRPPSKPELLQMIEYPDIADQSPLGNRFDASVQGRTHRSPYGPNNMPYDQSILIPIYELDSALVTSFTLNPHWATDPINMTKAVLISSLSKCVACGVNLNEIVLCDNFYTPPVQKRPDVGWYLKKMVDVCAAFSQKLNTPFISGKDSSSGSHAFIKNQLEQKIAKQIDVPITLCVSAVGKMKNFAMIPPKVIERTDVSIWLIPAGITIDDSGSVRAKTFATNNNLTEKACFNYEIDLAVYQQTCLTIIDLIESGKIEAISTIEYGGAWRRLVEMYIGSKVGMTLMPSAKLFRSYAGSFLVVSQVDLSEIGSKIGVTNSRPLLTYDTIQLTRSEVINAWQKPFKYFNSNSEEFQ